MKQEGGKQKMDGILFIDKEKGWTSRDVVNFISHQFQTKKVGHVGTLDPFATGLLIVLVGKATKIAPYLEAQEKEYEATLLLGADTDTLDLEGEVVLEKEVPDLSLEAIEETLHTFKGTIEQVVPKYSAVKYKGKALYRYAFANEKTPEISRKITIHDIHFMSYVDHQLSFSVHCSKGTYVRQLGQDIAHDLSTCGHLTSLRRTKIGEVSVFDAKKVKEINELEFKDVYFRYKNSAEDVLRNINFTSKKGETIAFIGSTGSGKSTIINLLPRLFDVTSGKIAFLLKYFLSIVFLGIPRALAAFT